MDAVLSQMIKRQVVATVLVALVAYLLIGLHGALSALAGGGAAILGSLAAAKKLQSSAAKNTAGSALADLLVAEVIKIAVIAIALLLVFTLYRNLIPLALIFGLGSAAIMSGAAIFTLNEKNNL